MSSLVPRSSLAQDPSPWVLPVHQKNRQINSDLVNPKKSCEYESKALKALGVDKAEG